MCVCEKESRVEAGRATKTDTASLLNTAASTDAENNRPPVAFLLLSVALWVPLSLPVGV